MQHGFGLLSGVLYDFWDLFHGGLHIINSKKTNTRLSTFLILLTKCYGTCLRGCRSLFWNGIQYFTLEWAQKLDHTEPFWNFAQRFVSFILFVNRFIVIPNHDFAKCVKTIEFGPFYQRFHAWLSTRDQKMYFPSRRANRFAGSNFMALIMLGKLLPSLSDRKFSPSCFSEHMIQKTNCENKDQL